MKAPLTATILLLHATVAFLTAQSKKKVEAPTQPNIVLIVTDDQGMDMLGCYGDPNVKTPAIDKLAQEGVRFTNAYCTTPSCSPSRSVILTGMHNHKNGQYGLGHSVFHFRTHENIVPLPVLLSRLGYFTIHAGKFHIYPKEQYAFDIVDERDGDNAVRMVKNFENSLARKPNGVPFFLYFATTDPHHAGGRNMNLPYGPDRFGNRDNGHEGVTDLKYDPNKIVVPHYLPDIAEARAELAQYYQSINRIDQGVEALVNLLKAKGMYDNTVIIFTSDNGAPFPGAKTNMYDAGVRLPFVVKTLPNQAKNAVSSSLISFTDITPTILDLAGLLNQSKQLLKISSKKIISWEWEYVANDTAFHGQSFVPILKNPAHKTYSEVFLSHSFHELHQFYPMRAIVTDTFKFIWNLAYQLPKHTFNGKSESIMGNAIYEKNLENFGTRSVASLVQRPEFELYNLKQDPKEINNLALLPEMKAKIDFFKSRIIEYQKSTKDPFIKMTEK